MYFRSGVPNAGKYNLSGTETVPIPAFFWSRSTYKRFQNMGMDNKVPGPGAYFDKKINEKREEEFLKSNARVVGALRGVKYLGKQNDKPVSAIHTFGADKDRFKHSFMGRLDLKAEIPGPGSYNDSVGSLSRRPKTSVQAFGSSGQRIADVCKHGVPGPAYYKASTPNYRPPTQNLDSHWI